MTEIEKLILAVETKGIRTVNDQLAGVEAQAKKTEKAFAGVKGAALAFVGTATALAGAAALIGRQMITATKTYQGFMAQLQTSTGSVENAKLAFQALQDFATTTPFSMNQATEAFLLLVNRGLDPSEKSLRALGNTASAMNRTILEVTEGVAQAVSGQYDRLQSLGIGVSKAGDQITFSFQGTQTVVKNTAKDIQDFITSIGENKFGNAMSLQMQTLNGAMSNLSDAWEQLWQNISNLGPGNVLTQGFKAAGDALTELNKQILSGQFTATLENFQLRFGGLITDATEGLKILGGLFQYTLPGQILKVTGSVEDSDAEFQRTLKFWPQYAKAAAGAIYLYLKKCWDDAAVAADLWNAHLRLAFDTAVKGAKIAGTAIAQAMTGNVVGAATTATTELGKLADETISSEQKIVASSKARWAENDLLMEQALEGIAAEVTATEKAYAKKEELADKARAKFDADEEARKGKEVLGQFGKGGGDSTLGADKGAKAAADKALAELQRQFEAQLKLLENSLTLEGQVIDTAYEARKEKILANTATTEAEKKNLILQALSESLVTEEQGIQNSYNARREFILSATAITEEAKTALMKRLSAARDEQIKKLEDKTMKERLGATAEFFGNIASIGSTFGKEAFEVAKIAAIAQATIKTYESATSAYAAGALIGGPVVGALYAAAAVAAGVANIATIKSQQFSAPTSGSGGTKTYAQGGMIPAGRYGVVGETGAEIVRGPAVVTSAATTAGYGRNSSGVKTVTIQNHGQPLEAESSMNGDELEIKLRPILAKHKAQVKDEMSQEIERGGGNFGRTLERNYGLRREGK